MKKKTAITPDPLRHFWFIYNPNALTPPTKQFVKRSVAEHVADELAKKYPGEKFFVIETKYCSCSEYIPNTGWAKETF